jgi:hypothetical protein
MLLNPGKPCMRHVFVPTRKKGLYGDKTIWLDEENLGYDDLLHGMPNAGKGAEGHAVNSHYDDESKALVSLFVGAQCRCEQGYW